MGKKRAKTYEVHNPEEKPPVDPNSKAEKERKKHARSAILAWTAEQVQHRQENPHRTTIIPSEKDKQRRRGAVVRQAIKDAAKD